MKNLRTILVVCIVGAGLAACSDSGTLVAPEGPRYDGGSHTVGSGSRFGSDSTSAVTPLTETTADDGTANRGGSHTVGSGS